MSLSVQQGGDFPFLANADEANLYIEVHMRGVGAVPQQSILAAQAGAQEEREKLLEQAEPLDTPAQDQDEDLGLPSVPDDS
mmetsp:Transcript_37111/g.86301  ORF Transcript_37111/g.86301 Transcript_37111/m.86301 type:complete len:81 (+) Transcript_37111:98-340(+)